MKVKTRLALQFTVLFAGLLLLLLFGIYSLVERNRRISFYDKLEDRAMTVAQFYLAEDNLSEESFKNVLKKYPRSLNQEVIRIYNDQFDPVFIKEDTVRWNKDLLHDIVRNRKLRFSQGNQQVCGIYYADNSGNFLVVASAVDAAGIENMQRLAWIMTFAYLAALIITYIIGRLFAHIALMPINHIIANVQSIRASSLDKRLKVRSGRKDELSQLSTTINQLLEHLEQSFEAQRVFIANASHELRTPITSILGEAEITLLDDRQTNDYKRALRNIIEESDRLNGIIGSLLELAQANMDYNDLQRIPMDELLWEVAEECGQHGRYQMNLNFHTGHLPGSVMMQGHRHLLFIALSNVVKNAIKFSNGKMVTCDLVKKESALIIKIIDRGIGIPPEELHKIFLPFYRSPHAKGFDGHGIGLSLTEKIVRLHNGKIEIFSEVGQGTAFHLTFQQ
ncbi:signal transduction histidine kinase [Chitinophaga dinghuensis]|uniref:histidine kinase n=1 Tax=Chitinophaga dinghuensis TaxID=1539050 RepID=A0A327W0F7_9BACT|nr:HAMP domain-containing sensor histidine kinase [Chitinophaga dinghuensis]RAJ81870.1 signal transduction histidine kinase [Chitinophaga dinghuensis]